MKVVARAWVFGGTTWLVAVWSAACGSGNSPTASTSTPPPRSLAISADVTANALVTAVIDPLTGALRPLVSSPVLDPLVRTVGSGSVPVQYDLAADPRGRSIYLAIGKQLVSYALDGTTGALVERARVLIDPQNLRTYSIVASERQIHGAFEVGQGFFSHRKWIAFQVDPATGVMSGRACFSGCEVSLPNRGLYGPTVIAPDAMGRLVYTSGGDGLLTSLVQSDGSLLDTASLPLGFLAELGASVPGFIVLSDGLFDVQPVLVDAAGGLFPGPRVIDPLDGSDVRAMAVGSNGVVALLGIENFVARGAADRKPWLLRTFAVDRAVGLLRRGSVSLPPSPTVRAMTWDPSGRFIFVTTSSPGIDAYADSDGALRPLATYTWGRGPIVTLIR